MSHNICSNECGDILFCKTCPLIFMNNKFHNLKTPCYGINHYFIYNNEYIYCKRCFLIFTIKLQKFSSPNELIDCEVDQVNNLLITKELIDDPPYPGDSLPKLHITKEQLDKELDEYLKLNPKIIKEQLDREFLDKYCA